MLAVPAAWVLVVALLLHHTAMLAVQHLLAWVSAVRLACLKSTPMLLNPHLLVGD